MQQHSGFQCSCRFVQNGTAIMRSAGSTFTSHGFGFTCLAPRCQCWGSEAPKIHARPCNEAQNSTNLLQQRSFLKVLDHVLGQCSLHMREKYHLTILLTTKETFHCFFLLMLYTVLVQVDERLRDWGNAPKLLVSRENSLQLQGCLACTGILRETRPA